MSIIRPPITGDSPQDSWANQVTEAINKGLLGPSINPSETAVVSVGGFSAATIYLYTRTTTATSPASLTEDLTYDYSEATFTTSPPFGSANWETSPPSIVYGDYLWVITVNIAANVGQEIIPPSSWSIPQIFSVNGSSSLVVEAYLRSASLPSTPTGGSYNFATKTLTPPSGGWSQSFPSGSNPVYIVTTTASVVGTEGIDSSLTWSSPVKMVEDGATGASTNIIFQRSATQPSTPLASANIPSGWYDDASSAPGTDLLWASSGIKVINSNTFTWSTPFRIEGESIAEVAIYRLNSNAGLTGGTYNFVTNTLTPPSGWSIEPPSLAVDGDIIYRASGVASGSAKETSASVTFGSAIVFARRTDGATGASTNIIFQRSSSQPSTPSASFGVPSGWYDDASSAPGTALLWASSGFKAVNSSTFTWTTPFRIEGESVAEVAIYRLNNNTGLTGGSYNFVTNTLTPPTDWLTSAPAIATNGDVVYRASGIASGSALETSASVTFGTPVVFIQRTDGINATEIETGLVYYNQASTNSPGTPTASGYNFSNNSFLGLSTGWQITPVTVNITTTTALFWSSRFRVTQAPSASSPTIVFDPPIPSVNFGTNIQSDNYITGSSGWQIQRASGDAEFNNVEIRGGFITPSIVAAAITSKSITADQIDVDTLVLGSKNILTIDGDAVATRTHRTTVDDYIDGLNNIVVGSGSANGSSVTGINATTDLRYRFTVQVDIASNASTNNLRTRRYYYPSFTAGTGYSIAGGNIEVFLVDDITSAQTTTFYVGVNTVDFYSAGGNNNSRQSVLSLGTNMYLNQAEVLRLVDPAVEFEVAQAGQLFEIKFTANGTNIPSFTAFSFQAYAVNIEEFFTQSSPGLYNYTNTFEAITNVQLTGTTSTTAYVTNVNTSNLVTNGSGALYGVIRGY